MAGSDARIPRDGKRDGSVTDNPSAVPGETLVPYDQNDWAEKLRLAREKRREILEQRGTSNQAPQLVRPEMRPSFAPPVGSIASAPPSEPALSEASVPDAAIQRASPKKATPTGPMDAMPTADRSQAMSNALRRRSSPTGDAPLADAVPFVSQRTATARRPSRPGVQMLAAFAMGLGVGAPLAAVAWFVIDRSGGSAVIAPDDPQIAVVQTAAPADPTGTPPAAEPGAWTTTEIIAPAMTARVGVSRDAAQPATQADSGVAHSGNPAASTSPATAQTAELALGEDAAAPEPPAPTTAGTTAEPESAASDEALVSAIQSREASVLAEDLPDGAEAQTALAAVEIAPAQPSVRPTPRSSVPLPLEEAQGPRPDGTTIAPGAQVRVYAPSRLADAQINAIASELRQSGAAAVNPVRTRLTIQDTHIRYYHAADAAEARAMADSIGADARDFTRFSPSPPEGTLEVWMAGRGAGGAPRRSQSSDSVAEVAQSLGSALSRLISSIPPSDPQH